MRYKSLGRTGLQVSEIGFGGSRLGGVFSQAKSSDESVRVLRKAFDAGITFYDTANIYSQGENESLLGQAFHRQRDKVVIVSKGGYCLPAQRKLIGRIKPLVRPIAKALGIKRENLPTSVSGTLSQDFSPASIAQALEGSLRRLKTDYLDIYQLHSPPAAVIESSVFADTLGLLETLKTQGKIRHYGVAADTAEDAELSLHYPGVASLQLPFGLLDLEPLDSVLAKAAAQGVGVIARGCFGGGLLKDSLTEAELEAATVKWTRILAYRLLAEKQKRPLLEIALQFSYRTPAVGVTLLGMRTEAHLTGNLRYYAAPPLTDAEYASVLDRR